MAEILQFIHYKFVHLNFNRIIIYVEEDHQPSATGEY